MSQSSTSTREIKLAKKRIAIQNQRSEKKAKKELEAEKLHDHYLTCVKPQR